jgi:hypothetical protein
VKYTISDISPAKYIEIAKHLLERANLKMVGNQGTVERGGFVVGYHYDPAAETVEIELVKKPWFVPQSIVDREVEKFVAGSGRDLGGTARRTG